MIHSTDPLQVKQKKVSIYEEMRKRRKNRHRVEEMLGGGHEVHTNAWVKFERLTLKPSQT